MGRDHPALPAIDWALSAAGVPAQCVAVLVALARHAGRDGRHAALSKGELGKAARKSVRAVKNDLDELVRLGLIRVSEDQSAVEYIRADRRPTVYDLDVKDARDGVKPTSSRESERGEAHDMSSTSSRDGNGVKPSSPRRNGVKPTSPRRPAETSHGVKPTSPEDKHSLLTSSTNVTSSVDESARSPRGSHLSDDWMPSRELIAQMRVECPDVDLQAEHRKFVDYWVAVAGAKGRKRDWPATWRNWIRRRQEDLANRGRNGSRSTTDERVASVQALKRRPQQPTPDQLAIGGS